MDRAMRHLIRMPHVLADHSQKQPLFHTAFCLGLFLSHRHKIPHFQTPSEVLSTSPEAFPTSSEHVPTNRPLHLHLYAA